jgi:hypothetical protein
MKSLVIVSLHQAIAASTGAGRAVEPTEEELFLARAEELRKLQPSRVTTWLKALVPASVAERNAARQAERDLIATFKRLEDLGCHLLGDIGVARVGPTDYVVRTDDIDAVRALRPDTAPLLPAFLPPPRHENMAMIAGRRSA